MFTCIASHKRSTFFALDLLIRILFSFVNKLCFLFHRMMDFNSKFKEKTSLYRYKVKKILFLNLCGQNGKSVYTS